MGDSDANDFTFCSVASQEDNDHLESPKAIPIVNKVALEDKICHDENLVINKTSSKVPEIAEMSRTSLIGSEEQKHEVRKPAVRAKVPFEKGYSQMDWLKLTKTHPDLAGLKGQSNRRLITMDEVSQHKDGSVWTVLKGRVYNISLYLKFHPGGADMLMKAAGRDCTSLFNKYHAWVNAEFLLEKCLVGVLDNNP
ncbi:hypothetical protein HPP92_005161 [Vanilla planifolia]|uniref:Cytochrome b5 heme-binding domain-containing protein n=1 Tax=Vanilla planifolia TaxID=51239 RepID=A0A835VCY1_VANPL|nr:hypothetical protein HPP92_005161 [Vanilla planifolia]